MTDARTSTARLGRDRLTPVGGRGLAGVAAWTAGAALLAGLGWLGWSALRPFDAAAPEHVDAISAPVKDALPARTLASRQETLDLLGAGANLFAPNRAAWPALVEATPDDAGEDPAAVAEAERIESRDQIVDAPAHAAPGDPIASIPVEETPPAAVAQRLRALSLLGIYGVGEEFTAVIRDSTLDKNDGQVHHHVAGDIVGKEQWELLGVDPDRDRVILRRAGVNVALQMYPESVIAAAPEATPPLGSVRPTPEDVRRELEAAGVSADDIAEYLRLAQSDDPLEGDQRTQANAEQSTPVRQASDAGSPAMPAELSALLREMTRPPREQGERGIDRVNREREERDENEGESESGG